MIALYILAAIGACTVAFFAWALFERFGPGVRDRWRLTRLYAEKSLWRNRRIHARAWREGYLTAHHFKQIGRLLWWHEKYRHPAWGAGMRAIEAKYRALWDALSPEEQAANTARLHAEREKRGYAPLPRQDA